MKQLMIFPLHLLQNCFESEIPARDAAKLMINLLDFPELKNELFECREQAYAGLNADIGDYIKAVQIIVLVKEAVALKKATDKQLLELQVEIVRLSN